MQRVAFFQNAQKIVRSDMLHYTLIFVATSYRGKSSEKIVQCKISFTKCNFLCNLHCNGVARQVAVGYTERFLPTICHDTMLPLYDVATKISVMKHVNANFLCILKRGNTLHVFDWSSKTHSDVA